MTVDQIKSSYSMRDIVERYGLKVNRAGFVRCPFHNEKTASLKVYKDSFFCFGCGIDGDIFTFVQKKCEKNRFYPILFNGFLVLLFVISLSYLVSGSYYPFLYRSF